jgi:hypothetical protein
MKNLTRILSSLRLKRCNNFMHCYYNNLYKEQIKFKFVSQMKSHWELSLLQQKSFTFQSFLLFAERLIHKTHKFWVKNLHKSLRKCIKVCNVYLYIDLETDQNLVFEKIKEIVVYSDDKLLLNFLEVRRKMS